MPDEGSFGDSIVVSGEAISSGFDNLDLGFFDPGRTDFSLNLNNSFAGWYSKWFNETAAYQRLPWYSQAWVTVKNWARSVKEWVQENVHLKFGAAGLELAVAGLSYVWRIPQKVRDGVKNAKIQDLLTQVWPFLIGGLLIFLFVLAVKLGR